MKVQGFVSKVRDDVRLDKATGKPFALRSVTIEGLTMKVGGSLELPKVNTEIVASVSVLWKKRKEKRADGSDDMYAEYHLAGWASLNGAE